MTVLLKLTTAGSDSGPFDLYSNLDEYDTAFEENVSKVDLTAGSGYSTTVPDGATIVRIKSTGVCASFVDITLSTLNCSFSVSAEEVTPTIYTIGQQALGGTIAWITQSNEPGYDPNVQHGLVVTTNDLPTRMVYGGVDILNVTGNEYRDGLTNTEFLVQLGIDNDASFIAAKACKDLVEGGYSDWFLPSLAELDRMYINRYTIGNFVTILDGNTFNTSYWTSCITNSDGDPEIGPDYYGNVAGYVEFHDGGGGGLIGRGSSFLVRPVRYF
jgi:hypothetical protein